jgi:hypothetical protein
MLAMAMDLMRKVDERMGRMEDKLDSIAQDRIGEAEDRGELRTRVDSIEDWRKAQDANTSNTRRMALGSLITTAVAILGFFGFLVLKLAVATPQVLAK